MKIVKYVPSILMLLVLINGSAFGMEQPNLYTPLLNSSPAPSSSSSSSSTKSASSTSTAYDIEMQEVAIQLDRKFAAEDKTGCWERYKQSCSEAIKRNWSKLSPRTQEIIKLTGLTGVSMLLLVRKVFGDEFPRVGALGLAGLAARVTKNNGICVQLLGGAVAAGAFAALNYYTGSNLWVPLLAAELYPVCCTLDKIVALVEPKTEDVAVQFGPEMV